MHRLRMVMAGSALLLASSPLVAVAGEDDAAAGAALVKARCLACHVVEAGQKPVLAPNLHGVVGRAAGSTVFNYSAALKASGLTWSKGELDSFLAAPMKRVPGTRMVIAVGDAKQRADVIAYLATLK